MNYLLIGAGGIGYPLAMTIANFYMERGDTLAIADGDYVERGNLRRQFFNLADVGRNKADRLVHRLSQAHQNLNFYSISRFVTLEIFREVKPDLIFLAVDNKATIASFLADPILPIPIIFTGCGMRGKTPIANARLLSTPEAKRSLLADLGAINDSIPATREYSPICERVNNGIPEQTTAGNVLAVVLAIDCLEAYLANDFNYRVEMALEGKNGYIV